MSSHEPVQSHRTVATSSDRAFGSTFAVIFVVVAIWPTFRHEPLRTWALAISIAFAALTIFAPRRLAPLKRLWLELGRTLHALVSPLIMGLLFFGAVAPIGALMRLFGRDPLLLRRDDRPTYWISREPHGPAAGSMRKQF
jgi:hypothetical protein